MKKPPQTITLSRPLVFGDQEISEIVIREPSAGDLRNMSLRDLLDMKVDALLTVLPRISLTPFPSAVLETASPPDLLKMYTAFAGFFEDSPTPCLTTP